MLPYLITVFLTIISETIVFLGMLFFKTNLANLIVFYLSSNFNIYFLGRECDGKLEEIKDGSVCRKTLWPGTKEKGRNPCVARCPGMDFNFLS